MILVFLSCMSYNSHEFFPGCIISKSKIFCGINDYFSNFFTMQLKYQHAILRPNINLLKYSPVNLFWSRQCFKAIALLSLPTWLGDIEKLVYYVCGHSETLTSHVISMLILAYPLANTVICINCISPFTQKITRLWVCNFKYTIFLTDNLAFNKQFLLFKVCQSFKLENSDSYKLKTCEKITFFIEHSL